MIYPCIGDYPLLVDNVKRKQQKIKNQKRESDKLKKEEEEKS